MVEAGLEAILVKVAALGLVPHKHLGKTIAQVEPLMQKLNKLYGSNVCGEGGEYETLTLDCPVFTRARIVLDQTEVVIHSADALTPVGYLRPKSEVLGTGRWHLSFPSPSTILHTYPFLSAVVNHRFHVQSSASAQPDG
jgi:hypothetical protein